MTADSLEQQAHSIRNISEPGQCCDKMWPELKAVSYSVLKVSRDVIIFELLAKLAVKVLTLYLT